MHLQQDKDDTRLISTNIYEDDIISGGEKKLREAIRYSLDACSPSVVFVVCGCTTQIMMDDVVGLITEMDTGTPIIPLFAPGFQGNYNTGVQSALLSLAALMEPTPEQELRDQGPEKPARDGLAQGWLAQKPCAGPTQEQGQSVNLIGLFPDDFQVANDIAQIARLLGPLIHLNAVFPFAPLKAVRVMPFASLNLVLPGFEGLGKHMEKTFDVPYITVRYPYGLEASSRFVRQVYSFFGLPCDAIVDENEQDVLERLLPFQDHIKHLLAAPCAVIGDGNQGRALHAFLDKELAMCVELFDTGEYGDLHEIGQKLATSPVALLFGDSFSKGIAREMGIPHINYRYPVVDQITCSARCYAGYEGCLYLVEDIINTVLRHDTEHAT
jgi:nitrogenase molybdenum-iron protein alpha/beta subunit